MNIQTQTKLLRLKSLLNQISDVSYAFNRINQQYPLNSLDDDKRAHEVISAYVQLLSDVQESIKNYEREKSRVD